MRIQGHGTRIRRRLHGLCIGLSLTAFAAAIALGSEARADDVSDLLSGAATASAPAQVTSPTAPENKPTSDALGTLKPRAPAGSIKGVITLNNGQKLEGLIWTTLDTPFRVWVDESKRYVDIDLALVSRIDAHVLAEVMEDDWRWLKEGSDQKVYSGKQYPRVELTYRFTLANGQVVEGTVVAPIYFEDGAKTRTLALYKEYKGKVSETLKDMVFITSLSVDSTPGTPIATKITKLPLLDE